MTSACHLLTSLWRWWVGCLSLGDRNWLDSLVVDDGFGLVESSDRLMC